jgi:biopolymer transport protein ExbD
MPIPSTPAAQNKYSEQYILNKSYDESYHTLVFQLLSTPMNIKITTSGNYTYVAKAPVGTAQASASWQAFRIDETTGMIILYADANGNYDNVATDLTALSYS